MKEEQHYCYGRNREKNCGGMATLWKWMTIKNKKYLQKKPVEVRIYYMQAWLVLLGRALKKRFVKNVIKIHRT